MTNITLSINDEVYKKMKKFSEIRWSEYVRKCIKNKIEQIDKIEQEKKESILNMLASEKALEKD